ncbi:hypothetical protein [Methanobrevibacter sp.]|uniref:hypothetical protein n=1 Tax=Methanobrevibacter sp. TaxID=66852 RepID=UPI00388D7C2B
MGLTEYNGFSPKEREVEKIQQEAIEKGELKPLEETRCFICGQDKGIRVYHVENYFPEKVVGNSIPMCYKCHSRVHGVKITNPPKFRKYLEEVREIPLPPTYNKNYWTPERDKILDDYHGFSADIREFSKVIIEKAIDDDELKPLNETKCSICGQDKGLRVYNVDDYTSPETIIKSAKPLCWTCNEYVERHEEKNPEIFEKYVKEVKQKPRKPVYITSVWTKEDDNPLNDEFINWDSTEHKFIRRHTNRYIIIKSIKGKDTYFGSYDTLEEALIARDKLVSTNWGFSEGENLSSRKEGKYGRYITFHNDCFRVLKVLDGKPEFFGAFPTPEEAKELRDLLIENDWDTSKIPPKYLRSFITNPNLERLNYIRKVKDKFVVSKVIDGELKYFGTYDTKEEAIEAREVLLNNNWQVEDTSDEEKIDAFVYLTGDEYIVKNEVGGEEKVFGRFDDMGEAIKFRNQCVRNNWKV